MDCARQVEDMGYTLLMVPDHLHATLSPLALLTAAAGATKTLRLGTLVLNNDFRHPAVLAREAATVDLLSDGRLELGLGAGHAFPEYERAGLRFDAAAIRIQRLGEAVRVVRRLLDGEAVEFDGKHYQLHGDSCFPKPMQAHVPLLLGGGSSGAPPGG